MKMLNENLVDKFFPKSRRFGMTLKSMLSREAKRTIQIDTKFIKIPFGISIINANVGWYGRGISIGKGNDGISGKNDQIVNGIQRVME
jgi:hypothetical protein